MTQLRTQALQALGLALGYADAHVREEGGNNRGPQVEFWQKLAGGIAGESWCADFQFGSDVKAWCQIRGILTGKTDAENRAIMLSHADACAADLHIPRTGSCAEVANAARAQGRFHSAQFSPEPGDLVLFDFKGEGVPHHVGRVVSRNVDGTLRTVEGNTGPGDGGSQGDGDGVYRRVRPRTHVYGFVHFE